MDLYNPFALVGKTVLITGASSGIGRVVAIECSKIGANLILIGRDENRLKETFEQLNGSGHLYCVVDLNSQEQLWEFILGIPRIDGLVHSAGILKRAPIKFISNDIMQETFNVNLFSFAQLVRGILKKNLFNEFSSIVLISSIASEHASIGNISYMSSKGALNSFGKGLAFELAKMNIRVNLIQPGMIKTNMTKAISDEEIENDIKRYPLGRYGKPEEVAYAVIYLLSNASQWMTGSKIVIDGGLTLR